MSWFRLSWYASVDTSKHYWISCKASRNQPSLMTLLTSTADWKHQLQPRHVVKAFAGEVNPARNHQIREFSYSKHQKQVRSRRCSDWGLCNGGCKNSKHRKSYCGTPICQEANRAVVGDPFFYILLSTLTTGKSEPLLVAMYWFLAQFQCWGNNGTI